MIAEECTIIFPLITCDIDVKERKFALIWFPQNVRRELIQACINALLMNRPSCRLHQPFAPANCIPNTAQHSVLRYALPTLIIAMFLKIKDSLLLLDYHGQF